MRTLLLLAALLGVVASWAQATTTTTTSTSTSTSLVYTSTGGPLAVAQKATGPAGKIVCVGEGAKTLIIDAVGSDTPSMTIILEHSQDGVSWATMTTVCYAPMDAVTLSTSTPSISWSINNPAIGCYRTNVKTYSSGQVDVAYRADL